MALYGPAIKKLIPPGPYDPKIKARLFILHVAVSQADSLYGWFNGPSGGVESHFYIREDGTVEQYRDTAYEADANTDANPYAISVETEGLEFGKWTPAQMVAIKNLILWCADNHGIPLKVPGTWNGSGVGFHTQFPGRWDKRGASCPGPDRQKQYWGNIVPWLKGEPTNDGGSQSIPAVIPPAYQGEKYWTPTGTFSVKTIQKIVNVTPDGLYGDRTEAAVARYQRDLLKVKADGYWGPETEAAYKELKARKAKPKAPEFPLPYGCYFGPKGGPAYSFSGYYGHREDLRTWQKRMQARGWTIVADGYYGPETKKVARLFQAEKGLVIDGLIGKRTWDAAWAKPITA